MWLCPFFVLFFDRIRTDSQVWLCFPRSYRHQKSKDKAQTSRTQYNFCWAFRHLKYTIRSHVILLSKILSEISCHQLVTKLDQVNSYWHCLLYHMYTCLWVIVCMVAKTKHKNIKKFDYKSYLSRCKCFFVPW